MFLLIASLLVLMLLVTLRAFNFEFPSLNLGQNKTTGTNTQVIQQTEEIIPSETPVPSETPTPEPTATILLATDTPSPTPTEELQPTAEEGCNVAVFVLDVTVPDKTKFYPDVKFTKTWRLLNNGTCTWTTDYKVYYYSGDQMSGPDIQRLASVPVPPGKTIDISVVLRAPLKPGTYKGSWALKDAAGEHFGLGSLNNAFYVEIIVDDGSAPTLTPTP